MKLNEKQLRNIILTETRKCLSEVYADPEANDIVSTIVDAVAGELNDLISDSQFSNTVESIVVAGDDGATSMIRGADVDTYAEQVAQQVCGQLHESIKMLAGQILEQLAEH